MFVKLEDVFGSVVSLNESADEKKFLKAFEKATGFKTHTGGRSYFGPSIGSAQVNVNLYDCLNYNKRLPRPGVYGDLEIKSATPMSKHEQAEMVIAYEGVEINCKIDCFYPPRVSKANTNKVIDLILKQAGVKADYEIVFKNHQPEIELSEENFNKIAKIKVGDKIGDFLVYDAGIADTKSVEQYYIVMTSYKEQFAMHVSKNSAIGSSNKMNESSNSELLKLAQTAAKSLGIKFKETPSSYKALMGASFEITEKDFIKIVNAFKRSQSDPAAFGFYEMTFDNPEMSVLIDFEDEEDSILFYVGGMSESSESNAANEATNTLNEASEDRMRKKARAIAKFFGVEIDETVGSFGFFASSAGIDKSSYDKIIKIINQTKDIEKKLGVNFVEVWSKVKSIRFNVYRSEDDIFFKLQGMNESYDHIPEYTPDASRLNESEVELNEVTGLPKYKTSVPSHLL